MLSTSALLLQSSTTVQNRWSTAASNCLQGSCVDCEIQCTSQLGLCSMHVCPRLPPHRTAPDGTGPIRPSSKPSNYSGRRPTYRPRRTQSDQNRNRLNSKTLACLVLRSPVQRNWLLANSLRCQFASFRFDQKLRLLRLIILLPTLLIPVVMNKGIQGIQFCTGQNDQFWKGSMGTNPTNGQEGEMACARLYIQSPATSREEWEISMTEPNDKEGQIRPSSANVVIYTADAGTNGECINRRYTETDRQTDKSVRSLALLHNVRQSTSIKNDSLYASSRSHPWWSDLHHEHRLHVYR